MSSLLSSNLPSNSNHEPKQSLTADVAQNRQKLSKMLQLHGYSACREALVLLEDHFTNSIKYDSMEDFINRFNRIITFHTNAGSSVIDPDLAHDAIKKLNKNLETSCNATPSGENVSNHQNVDENLDNQQDIVPQNLTIKVKNVQYEENLTTKISTGRDNRSSEKQATEFNIHYNFLYKRLSSLPIFQGDFQLTNLATLTGSSQPSIRCICFGLLIKDISKIDGYMLIDSTGRIPVRITPETTFRNRLAYTNCIVIVEGVYINPDDVLFVANVGLPPILLDPVKDKSLACVDEKMVVILKELYLDDDDICTALEMLFTGYNSLEDPPTLFILIGDFTRNPCACMNDFKIHMKKLVRIIRVCDKLKNCHFVFVPGLRDTGHLTSVNDDSNTPDIALPRPPLTKEQLQMNLLQLNGFEHVHLATNPAHIYLGERMISVVAHSYIKELRKNLLHDLSDHREELFETCKKIVLSNAHLSAGLTKTYHSSMNLWHRPDLLILADTEAFGNRYDYSSSSKNDTSFATIPSFSRQSNQFKVYYIKSGEIEDSQVSTDAYQDIEDDDNDEIQEVDVIEPLEEQSD